MAASGRLIAAIFNKTIAGATTDLLPANITPSSYGITAAAPTPTVIAGSPLVAYRVTVCLDTAVKFQLRYTDGSTTVDAPFNNDVALVVNSVNTFVFEAPRFAAVGAAAGTITAMSFNFQVSAGCVVNYLIVSEINSGVL